MSDHLNRVNEELVSLDDKIAKLTKFLDVFENKEVVGDKEWSLMRDQLSYMRAYSSVLGTRAWLMANKS